MGFPENDDQFQDKTIKSVSGNGPWDITFADGWSFYVPKESPVVPHPEMACRTYGKGIGSQVRGLFLDGQCVYYRTEAQDEEFVANQMYGSDAADWLARWDMGQSAWSVEIGGVGPGYEQAIQVTMAEIIRHMLATPYDHEKLKAAPLQPAQQRAISDAVMPKVTQFGLSGAQWGAALSLALSIYVHGPRRVLEKADQDRRILVNKNFPQLAA